MSDPCTKRRPMIDLEEFERSLRRLGPAKQKDGEPLAGLPRVSGGQDESQRTVFEPKSDGLAEPRQDKGEPGEWTQPDAQAGVIAGDFTAIEVGLLGARQPQAAILPETGTSNAERKKPNAQMPLVSGDFASIEAGLLGANKAAAIVSEAEASNAFLSVDLGAERWRDQDGSVVSHYGGVAGEDIRSRRRLYAMGAIIIAGMAGVAASFGIKSVVSGPLEIAPITAENGPAKLHVETSSGANVPAEDAASLSKTPDPSPVGLVNNTGQPAGLPQAEETTPRAIALGNPQAANGPANVETSSSANVPAEDAASLSEAPDPSPVGFVNTTGQPAGLPQAEETTPRAIALGNPQAAAGSKLAAGTVSMPAPAQTQTQAEPLSMAAPAEPEKMQTGLNLPDGALLRNDTPPQANAVEAPLPARRPAAKAKAPAPKTAASLAKMPKPAAPTNLGGSVQPAQSAKAGKAKPAASAVNAKPVPIADAQAEAPANQPSPATNGAFGFMQSAVNSLTSTTAKVLEWGSHP